MNVLLYTEGMKYIEQSGVGRAIKHQMKALELNDIPYTTNKKDKGYNIIHINTVGPFSCLLARKAQKNNIKVIMHAHSTQEDFRDSFFFANKLAPLFKKWLIYAYGQADLLITPTPYSKKLIDSYDIGLDCHAVSNGVDLTKFVYSADEGINFRNEYDFKHTDTIVLSVGLQIKRKGILDFITIAKNLPDIQFVWCGYTDPRLMTKDVKEAMKDIPENIHFLGYINNMISAYSASNLFFMPTKEETEGIVVLEALAIKKPVLIRDIPVYDEWLEDGINCHKATSVDEFQNKIQDILSHRLGDTTEEGYKVVQDRTLDKIGVQLKCIYKELLKL